MAVSCPAADCTHGVYQDGMSMTSGVQTMLFRIFTGGKEE